MASALKMNGKLRIRRRLSMTRAQRVSAARHIVIHGLVDTGSEWDGWHIRRVYQAIRPIVESDHAALDLVRAIWENRAAAYQAGKVDYEAALRKEEPWTYELVPALFEDEVTHE